MNYEHNANEYNSSENNNGELVEATATVIDIEGDMAVLETKRTNACAGCGASGACGTSALGELFGRKRNIMRIENDFEAVRGEQVIIGLPENDLILASLTAYMLPLAFMLFLPLGVLAFGFSDKIAGLSSLIGLGGGFWLASYLTNIGGPRFLPKFLRRSSLGRAMKSCEK